MSTDIRNYIKSTNQVDWTPLHEAGIDTSGIYVKPLRMDADGTRPISFLLKFEAGSSYPYHNHPAGEEILVLEGSCIIEQQTLKQGDYLYTPPGFKHAVSTQEGCVLFLMVPLEVEIL